MSAAHPKIPVDAIVNLVNYQQQCDEDGVMVQVSRQALAEVLVYVTEVRPDNKWGDVSGSVAQGVQEIDAWMRADGSAATVNPMTAGMWKAQGHTIEPLYRHPASQVPSTHQSEAPGDIADRWPIGCHSPASCSRNGKCMYIKCRHDGKDIKALASAFSSTQSGGGK